MREQFEAWIVRSHGRTAIDDEFTGAAWDAYQAGHAAARAEAEALLREAREFIVCEISGQSLLRRIDAYLTGGGDT